MAPSPVPEPPGTQGRHHWGLLTQAVPLGHCRHQRRGWGSTWGPGSGRTVSSTWLFSPAGSSARRSSQLCPLDRPSLFRAQLQHHLQEDPLPFHSAPVSWDLSVTGSQGALACKALPTSASFPPFLALDSKRGSSAVAPWSPHLSTSVPLGPPRPSGTRHTAWEYLRAQSQAEVPPAGTQSTPRLASSNTASLAQL